MPEDTPVFVVQYVYPFGGPSDATAPKYDTLEGAAAMVKAIRDRTKEHTLRIVRRVSGRDEEIAIFPRG